MKQELFGFFFSFRQTHHFFMFLVGVKNLGGDHIFLGVKGRGINRR